MGFGCTATPLPPLPPRRWPLLPRLGRPRPPSVAPKAYYRRLRRPDGAAFVVMGGHYNSRGRQWGLGARDSLCPGVIPLEGGGGKGKKWVGAGPGKGATWGVT